MTIDRIYGYFDWNPHLGIRFWDNNSSHKMGLTSLSTPHGQPTTLSLTLNR